MPVWIASVNPIFFDKNQYDLCKIPLPMEIQWYLNDSLCSESDLVVLIVRLFRLLYTQIV